MHDVYWDTKKVHEQKYEEKELYFLEKMAAALEIDRSKTNSTKKNPNII